MFTARQVNKQKLSIDQWSFVIILLFGGGESNQGFYPRRPKTIFFGGHKYWLGKDSKNQASSVRGWRTTSFQHLLHFTSTLGLLEAPFLLCEGGVGREIDDNSASTRYCARPTKGGVKREEDKRYLKKLANSGSGVVCETWLDDGSGTDGAVQGIPLAGSPLDSFHSRDSRHRANTSIAGMDGMVAEWGAW